MSELHELLVIEAERLRPAETPNFDTLTARAHRRRIIRAVAVVAAAVAVVGGSTAALVSGTRGGEDKSVLVPAAPVVTRGECAGLNVTATLVGRPGRWRLQAGTQPRPIPMPPDALMYLRARGPCVQRLRMSATNDLIQTATGGVTTFNAQGIGVIVSNGNPGEAAIRLFLVCAKEQACPASAIATVPVTVTRHSTAATLSPSPSP
jgi:hypothetical protein